MTDNGYMNKNEDAIKKNRKAVKWSPRVSKDKLARLYKSTCQGIWDEGKNRERTYQSWIKE